jgi:MFS family permease
MIAVALPSIGTALHAELSLVTSLLVTSYLIVNIVAQSPGGRLADALGHARTVRIGLALQAGGGCVGFVARGLSSLMVARSMIACGGALIIPATLALVRVHVPAQRRGRVFGWFGATMGLSAAVGPPLGGELLTLFGWRSIFVVGLPFVALAAVLTRIYHLPPSAAPRKTFGESVRTFDWIGTALLAVALAALVVASKAHGQTQWLGLAGSVALGIAFVLWEGRSADPVLDPRMFRLNGFGTGTLVIALWNFAMYGLLFQLPGYFERVRGVEPHAVGRVLFTMMLAMFVCAPLGGRLTDRLGPRNAGLLAVVPNLAGMLMLRGITSFQKPIEVVPALVLLGIGSGLANAPAQTAAMAAVGAERSGMAAGATSMLRYLGSMTSVLSLGLVLGGDAIKQPEAHLHMIYVLLGAQVLASLVTLRLPKQSEATAAPRR